MVASSRARLQTACIFFHVHHYLLPLISCLTAQEEEAEGRWVYSTRTILSIAHRHWDIYRSRLFPTPLERITLSPGTGAANDLICHYPNGVALANMLLKRVLATREARAVFNIFTVCGAGSKQEKRAKAEANRKVELEGKQVCAPKKKDGETDSSVSHGDVEEVVRVAAPDERQVRNEINAKNAAFYDKGLAEEDDIRLLRIEPGEGPIRASLQDASMVDPNLQDYDALSYCWGSQKDFLTVTVDDQDGFLVSQHLHAALLRLRRPDCPRLVWVDVICVNQDNIPERNRSVSLIWKIYTKARRVIVWIGETEPGKANCPRRWPNAQDPEDTRPVLCAKPRLAALEHDNVKVKLNELLSDMNFGSATQSSGEVWWKRLWVVQEFSCARTEPTVYIGPHAISWQFFSELMHTQTHDRLSLFQSLRSQEDQTLLRLIFMAKTFHCSDPKDRIYALLGLTRDGPSPIVPDYSKSVRQVYEEATLHLIQEEGNIDVLLDERLDRANAVFPSWVPDLTLLRERDLVRTADEFAAGHADENVCPDVDFADPTESNLTAPLRVLRMKALRFDRIVARTTEESLPAPDFNHRGITSKHFHKAALSEPLQTLRHVLDQLKVDFSKPAPHGLDRAPSIGYLMLEYLSGGTRSVVTDMEQVSRHTHVQDKLRSSNIDISKIAESFGIDLTDAVRDDFLVSAACESAFLWTRHTRTYNPDDSWKQLWSGLEPYQVSIKNHKRDFFSTASGFIGLGPATLQVGDEVVVPLGASRPFLLRRQGECFALVGDAVMPGIMSGQLINLRKEGVILAKDYYLT